MSTRKRARKPRRTEREEPKPRTLTVTPRKIPVKRLGNGVSVIQTSEDAEPIYVNRDPALAAVPNEDLGSVSTKVVHDFVYGKALESVGLSPEQYDSDVMTDEQRQVLFLLVYAEFGNVRRACQVAGVRRRTVEEWRTDVEDFAATMDDAYEDCVDALEEEARLRAVGGRPWSEEYVKSSAEGGQERVVRRGVHAPSDSLMMFLLRGQRSRYAARNDGGEGRDSGNSPVRSIVVTIVDPEVSEEARQ